MTIKLHTQNFGGNIHQAANTINKWGWAEYLVQLDSVSGTSTIGIFKMPAAKVHEIRTNDRSFVADPHHDDYIGPPDPYISDYRLTQVLATVEPAVRENEAKQEQPPVAQVKEVVAKPKVTKPKKEKDPEKPVEQVQETPEGDPAQGQISSTGVDMNAAESAMNNDLPDWAK